MHNLTPGELQHRLALTPGAEHLAELVQQLIARESLVRVDLDKLLRKPDSSEGSSPPA